MIDTATGGVVGSLTGWSLAITTVDHASLTFAAPTPLPVTFFDYQEATEFRVNLAQVQTGVGTYSYAIGGGTIQDLVRTAAIERPSSPTRSGRRIVGLGAGGAAADHRQPGVDEHHGLADPRLGRGQRHLRRERDARHHDQLPNDANLTITLTSPANVSVTLVSGGEATGANFTNTAFSDSASQSLGSGSAPFTGLFKPAQALAAFANGRSTANGR